MPESESPATAAQSHAPLPATSLKAVFHVEELAQRWAVHPESVRKLIRARALRPLRGFRPYRIPFDEVRRYETHDEARARQEAILRRART